MVSKDGWKRVALGDVVRLSRQRSADPEDDGFDRYVGLEHIEPGNLNIRRWGDIANGTTFTSVFRAGQVLFGKRRAYQRKVAVADFEGVCSGDIYVLEAKSAQLLPELLPFICQADGFFEHAVGTSAGSLSPRTNWESLASYEFALPPPEEQRRAAAILAAYQAVLEANRGLALAARQTHRALRMNVFGLVLREGDSATRSSQDSRGRGGVTIAEAAEFLDGRRIPLKDSDRAARQGPYPYYGASGVIDRIDDFIFDEELLLVSEDGANLIDRTTPIAFLADGRFWVNNHAHVLRSRPPFSNFLLCEYFESLNLRPYITGTAQPKLNKAACENIRIPKLPDAELRRIEEVLRASLQCVDACERRALAADGLLRDAIGSLLNDGEKRA